MDKRKTLRDFGLTPAEAKAHNITADADGVIIDGLQRAAIATREKLEKIGRALHGEEWLFKMAKAMDINDRTLRHVMSGRDPFPPGLWPVVAQVWHGHIAEMMAMSQDLGLGQMLKPGGQ